MTPPRLDPRELEAMSMGLVNLNAPSEKNRRFVSRPIPAEGGLLSPKEFLHLGTRAAIDQTLTRLTKEGLLLRVGRGVYALPVHENDILGFWTEKTINE